MKRYVFIYENNYGYCDELLYEKEKEGLLNYSTMKNLLTKSEWENTVRFGLYEVDVTDEDIEMFYSGDLDIVGERYSKTICKEIS